MNMITLFSEFGNMFPTRNPSGSQWRVHIHLLRRGGPKKQQQHDEQLAKAVRLFFFSQLVNRPLLDTRGEKIGMVKDVLVRINPSQGKSEETYPSLTGLLVRVGRRQVWISTDQIATYEPADIRLASAQVNLERFVRHDGEILLGEDVLDKQLVDVEGRRVIRVNDLALAQATDGNGMHLLAVDVSFRALTRRLLPRSPRERILNLERRSSLLDWADVQYFATSAPAVQLNVSHERLGKLHPADLARLFDELSYAQRNEVLSSLSDETAADALEAMEPDDAANALEDIGEERAADLLEEIRPDIAADIVADMDEDKAQTLLRLMDRSESQDVQALLAYDEDTAGGIMTNEFVYLSEQLEAAEALRTVRQMEVQPEFVDDLYVVEPGTRHLVGVASLRDVVFCPVRSTTLGALMEHDVVAVHPETPAREAASLLAEYTLRSLPVVDEEGNIQGIITFDDALYELLPDDLRERVPFLSKHYRNRFFAARA